MQLCKRNISWDLPPLSLINKDTKNSAFCNHKLFVLELNNIRYHDCCTIKPNLLAIIRMYIRLHLYSVKYLNCLP